jgi:PAS domain S-box-containing protein
VSVFEDITKRKAAEEALKETNETLSTIIQSSPLAIITIDPDGNVTKWNPAAEQMFGWLESEVLGQFLPIVSEDKRNEHLKLRERVLRGEAFTNIEVRRRKKDGSSIDISISGAPLHDSQGRMAGIMSLSADITERKRTEEALRISQEKLREAHRLAHIGVWNWVAGTDTVLWTEELYSIAGLDPILPAPTYAEHSNIYAQESWDILKEAVERAMKTGETYQLELKLIRPDGTTRWVNAFGCATYDNHGRIEGLHGTVHDITERKQAEETLQKRESLLQKIFDVLPVGLWFADKDGKLLRGNPAGVKIWGAEPKIAPAKYGVFKARRLPSGEEIAPEDWALVHTVKERVTVVDEMLEIDAFDGKKKVILNYTAPVLDDQGAIQGAIVVNLDITERKQAEEELKTSRSQLRALSMRLQQIREEDRIAIAREIHDEMGGGLTGLKMDLSWLSRKIDDTDRGEERIALMNRIHASNVLIDQMIQVVRRVSTHLRPSVLDDLGLIAALEWQLSEFTSRTEIPHEFTTTFEYVNMEEDTAIAVFRIFQEALTNVARHSRATKVAVVLREGERSLFGDESFVLEIRDNGRGITQEEILNPGSLGLLGMKERVLAFSGEISIYGKPGGGTTLILKIPLIQGEPS